MTTLNFNDELNLVYSAEYVLGTYLYLGQIKTEEGKVVVLSVGYKPDYALRKLKENLAALNITVPIQQYYLRKIRVGDTDDCGKIALPDISQI